MSIFKAYDIRGTVPDQLDPDLARRIGAAAVGVLGAGDGGTLVVGRDARTHSTELAAALIDGITSAGADVVDVGQVVTPLSYFACVHLGASGAVMTTASHNPPQYNGFKLCRDQAKPVSYETGIAEIEKRVADGSPPAAGRRGQVRQVELWPEYKAWLLGFAKDIQPLKVVVDTGNGVAGVRLGELFEALPCQLVGLYLEPDGTFPNHEANPLKAENLRDLQEAVRRERAELGVAFDGDGDRVAFVDERSQIVRCDFITAILAQDFLAAEPGAKIVYDLRSSWVVSEEIKAAGGVPIESRVGHSFLKQVLREQSSPFAGELSGHYYFRDASYTDNGELAMLHMLNHLGRTGRKLSEVVAPLLRYHASGEINFEVDDKEGRMAAVEQTFADGRISHLDGVTVHYADWWFNVRPSNTEPVLRLNLEAKTAEGLKAGLERVEGILKKA